MTRQSTPRNFAGLPLAVSVSIALAACGGGGGSPAELAGIAAPEPTTTLTNPGAASAPAETAATAAPDTSSTSDAPISAAALAATSREGEVSPINNDTAIALSAPTEATVASVATAPSRAILAVPMAATAAISGSVYYVNSRVGSDTNDGLAAAVGAAGNGPWRSLGKLKTVALKPGDTVRLACGGVWNESLSLINSGVVGSPITVSSQPAGCANKPVIDGSTSLPANAWTRHSGNIYKAVVPTAPMQVYSAAGQMTPAHHPNAGHDATDVSSVYLRNAANSDSLTLGSRTGSTYIIAGSDLKLPAGATLTAGTKVRIRTLAWMMDERNIRSVNGSQLQLDSATSYPVKAGWGYFLMGQQWMLDSPGEWHYDITSKQLFLWMPNSLAPASPVQVSQLAAGVSLASTKYITLDNLQIQKTGIGINAGLSTGIVVQNVRIEDTAGSGIFLAGSIGAQVLASNIARTGRDAIAGVDPTSGIAMGMVVSNTVITDSAVLRSGNAIVSLPVPSLAAISAGGAATLTLNQIAGSAYHGIRASGKSTISNNVVDGACQILDDCGGIYLFGISTQGTTITGNIVSNLPGNLSGRPAGSTVQSEGIYLDDHAHDMTVSGNTVSGAETGMLLHNAFNNLISGNVLYGNRKHQLWLLEDSTTLKATGDLYGNVITDNQLFALTPTASLGQQSTIAEAARFASFDRNRYSGLISPRIVTEAWPQGSNAFTFPAWQAATSTTGTSRTPDLNGSIVNALGFASVTVLGANLVPNGDISQGTKGWTPWNATAPLANAQAQVCDGKPCLVVSAGGSNTLVASPPLSVVADKWYRVSFDLRSSLAGQPVSVLVRRGGGGTNGYESLMGSAEMVNVPSALRKFSFAFKASKSVNAADPVTRDIGARIYFDRIQPGSQLTVANLEMVEVSAADTSVKTQLFANAGRIAATYACPETNTNPARCGQYLNFGTGAKVTWPLQVGPFSAAVVYSRDLSLVDSDGDGISDVQDQCPGTPTGAVTNARGCSR